MRRLAAKSLAVVSATFALAGGACHGMTSPSVGSETNWLGGCTRDDECDSGPCVCGLCADRCDDSTPCPGTGALELCARPSSTAFAATCGGSLEKPTGLCLRRCAADVDCSGSYRCDDGMCIPIPVKTAASAAIVANGMTDATAGASAIGTVCTPSDEAAPDFPGVKTTETHVEDHSPACDTGFCLTTNFQGRVTCTYGQPADPSQPGLADPARQTCRTPGSDLPVTVPVAPQIAERRPESAVYCSCRCDGPRGTGPFCACPTGFECQNLVGDIGKGKAELAGSYCIKAGTWIDNPTALAGMPVCTPGACGPPP